MSRPVVVPAPHWVGTPEIEADLRERYSNEPKLNVWLRMLRNTGVRQRPWLSPLTETAERDGVTARSAAAYEGARDLAVTAAERALEHGGWAPDSVDALVTTHTTSWTVPGLDVDLVRRLGLRPDVARTGLATVACAGGAQALIQATRFVRATPGARVLVVAAEALSTLYNATAEPNLQTVLYGGLFGDAAAAVLVEDTSAASGIGLVVEAVWDLLLPDSEGAYWGVIDPSGLHFDSGRRTAAEAPRRAVPYLARWLEERPVSWAAVHPGGPRIVTDTLTGIGLDAETASEHAMRSLSCGNLGGVGVLDVLSRMWQDGPPSGPGVVVGYGPGFTVAALHLRGAGEGPEAGLAQ